MQKSNTAFNNGLFSGSSLPGMHPTMQRLFQAARELTDDQTPSAIARRLGESQQTLKNWETRGVSREGMIKAQELIGCRISWVKTGHGPMAVTPASMPAADPADCLIPQYNTGGMGGNGLILKDQPGVIQNWTVSKEWVRANVPYCTSPENLCIVTGFGDSMPDAYNPGDPVLLDRGVTSCDHDGIYFFRVGNEGFIKILQRIPGVGIMVISQNKNYRDWAVQPDMDFEVFGKVLRAWKGKNY